MSDRSARDVVAAAMVLADDLVAAAGLRSGMQVLLDDVRSCGPGALSALPAAA
jgi:hypothetical protein